MRRRRRSLRRRIFVPSRRRRHRNGWCRRCPAPRAFPATTCGGCRPRCTSLPNAADSSTLRFARRLRRRISGTVRAFRFQDTCMRQRLTFAAAVLLVAAAGSDASAQSVEAFYKGNRVSINIGYTPGGVYDIYARTIARHLGKHIPGRPTVVPREHAGRRQHEGGELHLRAGAQGRHPDRRVRARHRHAAAARRHRRAVRGDQAELARQSGVRGERRVRLAHQAVPDARRSARRARWSCPPPAPAPTARSFPM